MGKPLGGESVPGRHQIDVVSRGEELMAHVPSSDEGGLETEAKQGCSVREEYDRCAIACLTITFLLFFRVSSVFWEIKGVMNALEI
jgi:hypothetical protein